MAITMKSDPEKGWQTMALFDVDPHLIAQAKKHGIQCVQTSPGTFVVKNALQVFGTIPVKGTALTLAQQKALGPNSKIAFKTNFETALKKGIDASPKVTPVASPIKHEDADEPDPEDNAPIAWPKVQAAVPKSYPGALKLSDAEEVYQPVQGTSQGSTYYVFAMFPGLNLAARLKGTKLSVRAEGAMLGTYQAQLIEAFKMDKGVGYVSAHYTITEGAPLVVKTLAAIVGTIGFEKALKVADLKKFITMGA